MSIKTVAIIPEDEIQCLIDGQPAIVKKWFAYDDDCGIEFFETEQEAKECADKFIGMWRVSAESDGWDESVESVCYGMVTHMAVRVNEETIAGELDDESIDEDGRYWPDGVEFRCEYGLHEVLASGAKREIK